MTTSNAVQALRDALKARGWNRNKVSVRVDHSTIHVTIRDLAIPYAEVLKLARIHERVRRCEASGEILSGGNTFVDVDYLADLLKPIKAKYVTACAALAVGESVELDGIHVSRGDRFSYRLLRITSDGSRELIAGNFAWMNPHDVAYGIVRATLKREAL